MENYLTSNNVADNQELLALDEQVKKEIDIAEEFAENSPLPEGREALEGLYATPL